MWKLDQDGSASIYSFLMNPPLPFMHNGEKVDIDIEKMFTT